MSGKVIFIFSIILLIILSSMIILMKSKYGSKIEVVTKYAKNNNTVIISTHMIDIAQEISDKILILNNGKIQEYDNNFNNSKEIKEIILKQ